MAQTSPRKEAAIPMTVAHIWKSTRFTIECSPGKAAGTVIFRLTGPFTARDMYTCLSPDALRNTFESTPNSVQAAVHILDLTQVPYMDSAGLGMMVSTLCSVSAPGDSADYGRSEPTRPPTLPAHQRRDPLPDGRYPRGGRSPGTFQIAHKIEFRIYDVRQRQSPPTALPEEVMA